MTRMDWKMYTEWKDDTRDEVEEEIIPLIFLIKNEYDNTGVGMSKERYCWTKFRSSDWSWSETTSGKETQDDVC